jgi:hypothetical protein
MRDRKKLTKLKAVKPKLPTPTPSASPSPSSSPATSPVASASSSDNSDSDPVTKRDIRLLVQAVTEATAETKRTRKRVCDMESKQQAMTEMLEGMVPVCSATATATATSTLPLPPKRKRHTDTNTISKPLSYLDVAKAAVPRVSSSAPVAATVAAPVGAHLVAHAGPKHASTPIAVPLQSSSMADTALPVLGNGTRDLPCDGLIPLKEILNSIPFFYGNSDHSSEVVADNQFIAFVDWFEGALWKLRSAGIDSAVHIRLILTRLSGAMLHMFRTKQDIYNWDLSRFSVEHLRSALSNLFNDAEVRYTDELLALTFSKKSLTQSIQRFRTLAMYSSFKRALDHNKHLYTLLRRKLNDVHPNILLVASAESGLKLDESLSFHAYVDSALQIVARLQSTSVLQDALPAAAAAGPSNQCTPPFLPATKRQKKQGRHLVTPPTVQAMDATARQHLGTELERLQGDPHSDEWTRVCKLLNRCRKCFNNGTGPEAANKCPQPEYCVAERRPSRVNTVIQILARGKDPTRTFSQRTGSAGFNQNRSRFFTRSDAASGRRPESSLPTPPHRPAPVAGTKKP